MESINLFHEDDVYLLAQRLSITAFRNLIEFYVSLCNLILFSMIIMADDEKPVNFECMMLFNQNRWNDYDCALSLALHHAQKHQIMCARCTWPKHFALQIVSCRT